MNSAFVHIDYDSNYDDPPTYNVIYDDNEVLMYDIHEGGCFDIFDWDYKPEEIRTGYYQIEYEFEMECESYEMPHIQYPVLTEISIERFTFLGHFKHLVFNLYYLLTRTNRYTIGR